MVRAAGARKIGIAGRRPRTGERPVLFPLSMNSYTESERRGLLTFTNAPDLYTASARFVVAFPLEYSPKVYQSVDRQ